MADSYHTVTNTLEQGDGAPHDVHPYLLRRKGCSKTNYYQLMPRVSEELKEHAREYTNLCNTFEDFFLWVEGKVGVESRSFIWCAHTFLSAY